MTPESDAVANIAAYRFALLDGLPSLRADLLAFCRSHQLRGTILLSTEGINLFVAGARAGIDALLARLRSIQGLAQLEAKLSYTDHQPFRRMLVRIKKEIIAFGVPGIEPARRTSPKLAPRQLKAWLDEGRPLTLLDTRNDYEVKLGTFESALPVGVDNFREFPAAVARLPPRLKDETIVMFCTGGIRCEKAGPYMESQGFRNVLQLDGGILKYFEECGGAHYAVNVSSSISASAWILRCRRPTRQYVSSACRPSRRRSSRTRAMYPDVPAPGATAPRQRRPRRSCADATMRSARRRIRCREAFRRRRSARFAYRRSAMA